MAELQGQRLSLTFNTNGQAQVWLEDEILDEPATGTGSTVNFYEKKEKGSVLNIDTSGGLGLGMGHLNAARARLQRAEQALSAHRWSSYPEYVKAAGRRPSWLRVDRLLGEHGIPKDSPAGRGQFAARMEERRRTEDGREYRRIRRGWCYGEEAFRKELLGQMVGRAGENHYAEERQESDTEKARRIVAAELKRLNWTESELRRRRKGDPKKVRIARRLREKTTMTLKWIAEAL